MQLGTNFDYVFTPTTGLIITLDYKLTIMLDNKMTIKLDYNTIIINNNIYRPTGR